MDDPFGLIIAGAGPMAPVVRGLEGVETVGFVAPESLPDVLRRGSALVLPSRFEPWGVVVHEATCAGLGVIASTRVGAADEFVVDRVNGRIVEPSAEGVLEGLLWWHGLDGNGRAAARTTSLERSGRVTPRQWSATVQSMMPCDITR